MMIAKYLALQRLRIDLKKKILNWKTEPYQKVNFRTFIHRIPAVLQRGQGISYREIWMDLLQNSAAEKWSAGATDRPALSWEN